MLIIITALLGVFLLCSVIEGGPEDGIYGDDENSFWYGCYKEELEEELQKVRKLDEKSSADINKVYNKIVKKAEVRYRNIKLIFGICSIVFFFCLIFGSYCETNVTKYELLTIQDENIPKGLSKDEKFYICEYLNKDNSYMFYYKGKNGPEKMDFFADNIIKYGSVDCNPYVIEEKEVRRPRCDFLQKILFLGLLGTETVERNYKFYLPEENPEKNILKTFS